MIPDNEPKVPPNAFVLYMKEQYSHIQNQNPTLTENAILRELGRNWLSSSDDFKEKYRREAKELREQFQLQNPGFSDRLLIRKKKLEGERPIKPINVKVIINPTPEKQTILEDIIEKPSQIDIGLQ